MDNIEDDTIMDGDKIVEGNIPEDNSVEENDEAIHMEKEFQHKAESLSETSSIEVLEVAEKQVIVTEVTENVEVSVENEVQMKEITESQETLTKDNDHMEVNVIKSEDITTDKESSECLVTSEEKSEFVITTEETSESAVATEETSECVVTTEETSESAVATEEISEYVVTTEETSECVVAAEGTSETIVTTEEISEIVVTNEAKSETIVAEEEITQTFTSEDHHEEKSNVVSGSDVTDESTQNSPDTQKEEVSVFVSETKIHNEEVAAKNLYKSEFDCQTTIIITDVDSENVEEQTEEEVKQQSFITTKEFMTEENVEVSSNDCAMVSSSCSLNLESFGNESSEQTPSTNGKIVENEKIICNEVNDDGSKDEKDEADEVNEIEEEPSATPDLIKTCNEKNTKMNNSVNEVKYFLNHNICWASNTSSLYQFMIMCNKLPLNDLKVTTMNLL